MHARSASVGIMEDVGCTKREFRMDTSSGRVQA